MEANEWVARKLGHVFDSIRALAGIADAVPGDVGLPETHDRLVALAHQSFGRLAIAFNNAVFIGPRKPLAEVDLTEWQNTVSTTLTYAFLC